jgi:glutamate racemase
LSRPPRVLVFDSGLGGLTVYREAVKLRPDASYVYCADDACFPYSALDEKTLVSRVLEITKRMVERYRPDLIVVACNTASTVVLPELRALFDVPFVGTVPAIKPACAMSRSRLVSILGTQATVRREYTQGLIRDFATGCEVTLAGSASLAAMAEAALRDEAVADAAILAEIAPCFVEKDGRRTDVVVLACTHYPLILDDLRRLAPWPVEWLDPAPAIARRIDDLLGPPTADATPMSRPLAVFTSGKPPTQVLTALGFAVEAAPL